MWSGAPPTRSRALEKLDPPPPPILRWLKKSWYSQCIVRKLIFVHSRQRPNLSVCYFVPSFPPTNPTPPNDVPGGIELTPTTMFLYQSAAYIIRVHSLRVSGGLLSLLAVSLGFEPRLVHTWYVFLHGRSCGSSSVVEITRARGSKFNASQ